MRAVRWGGRAGSLGPAQEPPPAPPLEGPSWPVCLTLTSPGRRLGTEQCASSTGLGGPVPVPAPSWPHHTPARGGGCILPLRLGLGLGLGQHSGAGWQPRDPEPRPAAMCRPSPPTCSLPPRQEEPPPAAPLVGSGQPRVCCSRESCALPSTAPNLPLQQSGSLQMLPLPGSPPGSLLLGWPIFNVQWSLLLPRRAGSWVPVSLPSQHLAGPRAS